MNNKQIMEKLRKRGEFKNPEEVDKFFLECLEQKDKEKVDIIHSLELDTSRLPMIGISDMIDQEYRWKEQQLKNI